MVQSSDWRSPSSLEDYANHDFADFAQEFLRRNPDYRSDYAAGKLPPEAPQDPSSHDAVADKWGLVRRVRSPARPPRRAGSLGRRYDTRRSHAHASAAPTVGGTSLIGSPEPDRYWLAAA